MHLSNFSITCKIWWNEDKTKHTNISSHFPSSCTPVTPRCLSQLVFIPLRSKKSVHLFTSCQSIFTHYYGNQLILSLFLSLWKKKENSTRIVSWLELLAWLDKRITVNRKTYFKEKGYSNCLQIYKFKACMCFSSESEVGLGK